MSMQSRTSLRSCAAILPNEVASQPVPWRSDRPEERAAVEAWVRLHQVRAWRYVRLRGCPADLAYDLVQEALMAALHKGIAGEPESVAFAWLRGALDNLWLQHLRTEGRRQRHHEAARAVRALHQGAPEDDGEQWLQELRSCLRRLDGRARQLLELHYADGASRDAIGAALGMRANGVKARLRRVRDLLRDCVLRKLRRDQET